MKRIFRLTLAAATVAAFGAMQPAHSNPATFEETVIEIEQTLGFVPDFFNAMPENGAAGMWAIMKQLQMNPETALDAKTKELIGLAVAAQIPCSYCIEAHMQFAKANGRPTRRSERRSAWRR
jgi:AhpD family alkylhydroperoxidase